MCPCPKPGCPTPVRRWRSIGGRRWCSVAPLTGSGWAALGVVATGRIAVRSSDRRPLVSGAALRHRLQPAGRPEPAGRRRSHPPHQFSHVWPAGAGGGRRHGRGRRSIATRTCGGPGAGGRDSRTPPAATASCSIWGTGALPSMRTCNPAASTVAAGDRVRRGQVIARVGSSGTSGGPHLHFQVTDRPSIVAGDGLPYVFDAFDAHWPDSSAGGGIAVLRHAGTDPHHHRTHGTAPRRAPAGTRRRHISRSRLSTRTSSSPRSEYVGDATSLMVRHARIEIGRVRSARGKHLCTGSLH